MQARCYSMNSKCWLGLILALFFLLLPTARACAASFDCANARTRVERFVCTDPFISKLDSQLGKVYATAIAKADPVQKAQLVANQRHWMSFTRAACRTQTCFKQAYWSRLAELETFYMPHSPLYQHESDKAPAIKKIMAKAQFHPQTLSNPQRCLGLLSAVKSMKGIHFVDPVIQAESYEDPKFDSLRLRITKACGSQFPHGAPITFIYACKPIWAISPYHHYYLPTADTNKPTDGLKVCDADYGIPPYKLFEINSGNDKKYIFYCDNAYGPMNSSTEKPIYGWATAGFFMLIPRCGHSFSSGIQDQGTPPNYDSLIRYGAKYYYLLLAHDFGLYRLSINPVENPKHVCEWTFK